MDSFDLYYWMLLARELDAVLCAENPRWFPCVGEEAVIVGAFCDLRADDAMAVHYRDPFVAYVMRGAELWRLVAQVLGRSSGYNRGRSVPFTGPADAAIVPWVAGDLGSSLGVATGAALAFQQESSDRVCVCSFGDGTANRGDFHENLNLAAVWSLPIVYVCQNNGWAISQQAGTYLRGRIVDRAPGYGMLGAAVDGADVEAVRAGVSEAVERARRGHWAGDTESYRTRDGEAAHPDPISLLASRLIARGEASADDLEQVRLDVQDEVAEALARAREAPVAGPSELGLEEVYA